MHGFEFILARQGTVQVKLQKLVEIQKVFVVGVSPKNILDSLVILAAVNSVGRFGGEPGQLFPVHFSFGRKIVENFLENLNHIFREVASVFVKDDKRLVAHRQILFTHTKVVELLHLQRLQSSGIVRVGVFAAGLVFDRKTYAFETHLVLLADVQPEVSQGFVSFHHHVLPLAVHAVISLLERDQLLRQILKRLETVELTEPVEFFLEFQVLNGFNRLKGLVLFVRHQHLSELAKQQGLLLLDQIHVDLGVFDFRHFQQLNDCLSELGLLFGVLVG